MSQYSDQERQRIIDEARATVRRLSVVVPSVEGSPFWSQHIASADPPPIVVDRDPLAKAMARPIEGWSERRLRERREISERDEQFAIERAQNATHVSLSAAVDQRIAELEAQVAELATATRTYTEALEVELARRSAGG